MARAFSPRRRVGPGSGQPVPYQPQISCSPGQAAPPQPPLEWTAGPPASAECWTLTDSGRAGLPWTQSALIDGWIGWTLIDSDSVGWTIVKRLVGCYRSLIPPMDVTRYYCICPPNRAPGLASRLMCPGPDQRRCRPIP